MSTSNNEDLGHKLTELQRKSEHSDFEHVGYIVWVKDQVEESGKVAIKVQFPDDRSYFINHFDWPEDWNTDSKLKRLVEHDKLPFAPGSFTNEELQDEPVPIDPKRRCIKIPRKSHERVCEPAK